MSLRKLLCVLVLLQALLGPYSPLAAQELSPKDFDRLFKLIKPGTDESYWSEIPWLINMEEARKKAAAEGKPLVVWTMAGDALGHC
jgi:hypothetical protein